MPTITELILHPNSRKIELWGNHAWTFAKITHICMRLHTLHLIFSIIQALLSASLYNSLRAEPLLFLPLIKNKICYKMIPELKIFENEQKSYVWKVSRPTLREPSSPQSYNSAHKCRILSTLVPTDASRRDTSNYIKFDKIRHL